MTIPPHEDPHAMPAPFATLIERLRAASEQHMPQTEQHAQAAQAAALERLRALNDQVELFHDVREIVFADMALTSFPATCVRRIRGLYEAFDTKHPNRDGNRDEMGGLAQPPTEAVKIAPRPAVEPAGGIPERGQHPKSAEDAE